MTYSKPDYSMITKLTHITPPGVRVNVLVEKEDQNGSVYGTEQTWKDGVLVSSKNVVVTRAEKGQYYIA